MAFTKEHLQSGEEVLALANPHIVTVAGPFVTAISALVVCGVAAVLASQMAQIRGEWFLLGWLPFVLYLFWKIKVRTYEQYIITTHRVIKHEEFSPSRPSMRRWTRSIIFSTSRRSWAGS